MKVRMTLCLLLVSAFLVSCGGYKDRSDEIDEDFDNYYETTHECDHDPCSLIKNSTGKCYENGSYKFSCGCDYGYVWNESSMTCR